MITVKKPTLYIIFYGDTYGDTDTGLTTVAVEPVMPCNLGTNFIIFWHAILILNTGIRETYSGVKNQTLNQSSVVTSDILEI